MKFKLNIAAMRSLWILCLPLLLSASAKAAALEAASDTPGGSVIPQLTRQTQELYDAVVPGNQEPWKKYFADDCIFADEKGRLFDKAKLVADITPLPPGYSGTIKVEKVQSRLIGDTAVLSYD